MSDYFTHLAARSLNQDRSIQPRLSPLLGPPSFDATWTSEPRASAVETEEGVSPTMSADVGTHRSPTHERGQQPSFDPPVPTLAGLVAPREPLTASTPAPAVPRPVSLDLTAPSTGDQPRPGAVGVRLGRFGPRRRCCSRRSVNQGLAWAGTAARGFSLVHDPDATEAPGKGVARSASPVRGAARADRPGDDRPGRGARDPRRRARRTPRPQVPRGVSLEEYLSRQSRRGGP